MGIDVAEVVLLVVLLVLSVLLIVLGVQVFFILKEFRKAVEKANKVLDDASVITQSVSGPIATLSQLAVGIKTGASIIAILKGQKKIIQRILGTDEKDDK